MDEAMTAPGPAVRTEHDSLGSLAVPADAYYGIQTQRAIENFPLAHRPVRAPLIHAYGVVKLACAHTNHELGWEPSKLKKKFRAWPTLS